MPLRSGGYSLAREIIAGGTADILLRLIGSEPTTFVLEM
jgi:hypothetical protein